MKIYMECMLVYTMHLYVHTQHSAYTCTLLYVDAGRYILLHAGKH